MSKDIVQRLRERAALAAEEGDMTAKCDAEYFTQSANRIEALEAEVRIMVAREATQANRAEAAEDQASRMRDALEKLKNHAGIDSVVFVEDRPNETPSVIITGASILICKALEQ